MATAPTRASGSTPLTAWSRCVAATSVFRHSPGENEPPDWAPATLILACGALAREVVQLVHAHGWDSMTIECLPASLHNRPREIPGLLRRKIRRAKGRYDQILVAYGDYGTAGGIDAGLQEEGAERIDGAHCYEFYAGTQAFETLMEEEPGSFFLTDYLVRHFDRLIVKGLGLDRFPHLLPDYFGHYRRLIHLAQIDVLALRRKDEAAAKRLGLTHEYRFTGLGALADFFAAGGKPRSLA